MSVSSFGNNNNIRDLTDNFQRLSIDRSNDSSTPSKRSGENKENSLATDAYLGKSFENITETQNKNSISPERIAYTKRLCGKTTSAYWEDKITKVLSTINPEEREAIVQTIENLSHPTSSIEDKVQSIEILRDIPVHKRDKSINNAIEFCKEEPLPTQIDFITEFSLIPRNEQKEIAAYAKKIFAYLSPEKKGTPKERVHIIETLSRLDKKERKQIVEAAFSLFNKNIHIYHVDKILRMLAQVNLEEVKEICRYTEKLCNPDVSGEYLGYNQARMIKALNRIDQGERKNVVTSVEKLLGADTPMKIKLEAVSMLRKLNPIDRKKIVDAMQLLYIDTRTPYEKGQLFEAIQSLDKHRVDVANSVQQLSIPSTNTYEKLEAIKVIGRMKTSKRVAIIEAAKKFYTDETALHEKLWVIAALSKAESGKMLKKAVAVAKEKCSSDMTIYQKASTIAGVIERLK